MNENILDKQKLIDYLNTAEHSCYSGDALVFIRAFQYAVKIGAFNLKQMVNV